MKKFLSSLLVLALVVGCLTISVFAAGSTNLTASDDTYVIGSDDKTVTIVFSVEDATFNSFDFFLDMDNAEYLEYFEPVSIQSFRPDNGSTTLKYLGVNFAVQENLVNYTGTLFTVTFAIKADAENKVQPGKYPVNIDWDYSLMAEKRQEGMSVADQDLKVNYTDIGYIIVKNPDTPDEPPVHEHAWTDWAVTKAATCTEAGVESRSCACGETETREIAALGHDEVKHDAKAATCTEGGWNEYVTCTRCDYTTKVEIAALGHDEVKHEAKAATCTEAGWNEHVTCTRCDYTTKVEIAALGHNIEKFEAKAATCTEAGHNAYEACTRCDYTTKVEIAALGHDLTETVVDATCTDAGSKTTKCSRCDYELVEDIAALGHDWGEWVTIKEPTTEELGQAKRTCKRCGEVEYKDIPLLDPIPETGDVTAPFVMAGTLVMVMMAAAFVFETKRRTAK